MLQGLDDWWGDLPRASREKGKEKGSVLNIDTSFWWRCKSLSVNCADHIPVDATLAGLIPFSGPLPGVADAIGNAGLNDAIPLGYRKRALFFYPNGIPSFSPRVAESAKATLGKSSVHFHLPGTG